MATLLLRLSGPMQSWGTQSNFAVRDAGREPSKSGVIGLVCAALGRPRQADIADLAVLRMGVRIDQEGLVQRDYQTAGKGGYLRASGAIERRNLIPSSRYFLADARYLVGLEGADADLLRAIHQALGDPHWPLFLGRKAFPPGEPIWLADGLQLDATLEQSLCGYRWLGRAGIERPEQLRVVWPDAGGPLARKDQPLSFSERRFDYRRMRIEYIPTPAKEEAPCTSPS